MSFRKAAFLVLIILMGSGVVQAASLHVGMPAAARNKGRLPENVRAPSAPSTPTGPAELDVGESGTFGTGGAMSMRGYKVEYRFDWGDGTYSSWGLGTSTTHDWMSAGTYAVKAQARYKAQPAEAVASSVLNVRVVIITGAEVLIPAGNFNMGDALYATPIHVVHLDSFYIDKYEVTFDQYDAFCAATGRAVPSDNGWGRGTRPVINITWADSNAYCAWAGRRLPTEAEWERACRAGTNTAYCFGDDPGPLGTYAWYDSNSGSMTHPVGEKAANQFGLYDMHGNVWEWTADWYDSGYYGVSPLNDPPGPASGSYRIFRGGSWCRSSGHLRSGTRSDYEPGYSSNDMGCRCARTP